MQCYLRLSNNRPAKTRRTELNSLQPKSQACTPPNLRGTCQDEPPARYACTNAASNKNACTSAVYSNYARTTAVCNKFTTSHCLSKFTFVIKIVRAPRTKCHTTTPGQKLIHKDYSLERRLLIPCKCPTLQFLYF